MYRAIDLINYYKLIPHPEGGYYKETYRAVESIAHNALPGRFKGVRNFSTAIYFLLQENNFSSFHRIQSDECWHFYAGGRMLIHLIDAHGNLETIKLGPDILSGERLQFVVPAGCWFASETMPATSFSLVGCTVAPGFDFADFELANADELSNQYPQHEVLIRRLTR
ncbi:cupin domain-containing protein [Panacibacter ginsenosidivorans]|uniref:Cupin domain-containing protein n=1 Tax=Panacibacter ginsenosidivorans TaxID=1813871 RepID=A0A5B8V6Q2_9BACT|nr:cupin domain-containing protein [Panacibacter ginsenosidivorans]QEC67150.1 cupin domain-containing protein [Panacibacter ginsenosidivorans]